jgi:hypothetical protein
MHEQMKPMGYGQMPGLAGIGDGPHPIAATKLGMP